VEIRIEDVSALSLAEEQPATFAQLLAAGKKLPAEATSLLMQDHAEVAAMFSQFKAEEDAAVKAVLALKICMALTVHAQIEEELFYQQAARTLEDDELVAEAVEEHAEIKEQIGKILKGTAADSSVGPQMAKLMRLVEHHVAEEETGMFPDIQRTEIDLYKLGGVLAARRLEVFLQLERDALAT